MPDQFFPIKNIIPKGIECLFKGKSFEQGDIVFELGILKVSGHYPKGSEGALIGEYLRGLSVFVREIYRLDALILDLSSLDYVWGNNLLGVVAPETLTTSPFQNTWVGYCVIASEKNKEALNGLFNGFGQLDIPIVTHELEAISLIKNKMNKV